MLIKDRTWLARALDEVPPEWFETVPLREVYEALRRSPENVGSPIFLEQLSPEALKAWAWLGSVEPKYGTPNLDQMYVDACRMLEARPLRRQLDALTVRRKQEKLGQRRTRRCHQGGAPPQAGARLPLPGGIVETTLAAGQTRCTLTW